MSASRVTNPAVLLAFAAIYILWGSTFLAIRFTVAEIPPLLAAGLRFTIAGSLVYGWAVATRRPQASRQEMLNAVLVGIFVFVLDYGALFWAETRLPSGLASVLVAGIPIWTVILEALTGEANQIGWARWAGVAVGLLGVIVLMSPGSAALRSGILPVFAILGSGVSWSIGSILIKRLALPKAKSRASGLEMLSGGLLLLLVSSVFREIPPLPHPSSRAVWALGYLVVAGSIVGFSAYVYLLGQLPASSVASYAYVNPAVALLLGAWLGKEEFGLGVLAGGALIGCSVFLILRSKRVDSSMAAASTD